MNPGFGLRKFVRRFLAPIFLHDLHDQAHDAGRDHKDCQRQGRQAQRRPVESEQSRPDG